MRLNKYIRKLHVYNLIESFMRCFQFMLILYDNKWARFSIFSIILIYRFIRFILMVHLHLGLSVFR